MLLNLDEAVAKYGKIENGIWNDEKKWCIVISLPIEVAFALKNSATGNTTSHIYCNVDMAQPLMNAFCNIRERGLLKQLSTFDGCYNIRDTRGEPGKLSNHAYALAVDINASLNKLGCEPTMTPELVKCFTDEGFIWGGNYSRRDGMHMSYANW